MPHPFGGQNLRVADFLYPYCYGVLVRNRVIWTSSQVPQNALASLLEQCEFDNVFSGSPILRQILGGSVKLVLQ